MRSLGLAFALSWLPVTVQAQVGSCLSLTTRPSAVAPGYAVHVLSAFAQGEDVAVLGWPAYEMNHDSADEIRITDSLFAGIVVRSGAAPRKIPRPFPARSFEEPWLVSLTDRGARLLFLISVPQREPLARRDSIEIWSGVLNGTTWSDLNHLVTVGGRARLHTQAVPAVFRHGDSVTFAFGETRSESPVDGVTLLTWSNERWTVQRDTTVWHWIDYVDFAPHRDTVWMASIGMPRAVVRAGGWRSGNSVYVTKHNGSGWNAPVRIADGTSTGLFEPRLLSVADGLYLAWREDSDGARSLRWRGLSAGTDTTPRERPIVSRVTPGSGAWRDILTFTTDDTTGVIARPGAGGLVELGRLRVGERLPPLVVAGPRGPIAVTLTPAAEDPEISIVGIFDLRCALGPARPDPYRR